MQKYGGMAAMIEQAELGYLIVKQDGILDSVGIVDNCTHWAARFLGMKDENPSPTTYHLSPTTYHLPPTTYHLFSSLATIVY
jgi:hypothetical protein